MPNLPIVELAPRLRLAYKPLMNRWIKRLSHRAAVLLYATLELLDLPKIQDLIGSEPSKPSKKDGKP